MDPERHGDPVREERATVVLSKEQARSRRTRSIAIALALGALVMVNMPNTDPMKLEALRSHMSGGILILVLMLIRLFVRMRTRHPAAATAGNPLLDRIGWASHRMA